MPAGEPHAADGDRPRPSAAYERDPRPFVTDDQDLALRSVESRACDLEEGEVLIEELPDEECEAYFAKVANS